MEQTITCRECRCAKSPEDFYRSDIYRCKTCRRSYGRKQARRYYNRHRKQVLERLRRKRRKNAS